MPIALPVSSPVANGKGSTSLICEIGIFGIERRIYRKGATDVRASNGLRSLRHSKEEPPLQKRGLPLAASSLVGDRVPLGPREALEHPDTSGTVRDVRAPRGHDGPPRFEEV